jgi:hypothetical protein
VRADIKQIQTIAVTAAADCDPTALRTEQLNDQNMEPILEEAETRQRLEWKDVAKHRSIHQSYWAQWKSLTVRNSILQHHRESTDGRYKIVQIVFLRSSMNNMLTELNGRSGSHFGVNKTLDMVWERYYCLHVRFDAENQCWQCHKCAASHSH